MTLLAPLAGQPTGVLLIDSFPLRRIGMRQIIKSLTGYSILREFHRFEDAVGIGSIGEEAVVPDILLFGQEQDGDARVHLRQLRQQFPDSRIIILINNQRTPPPGHIIESADAYLYSWMDEGVIARILNGEFQNITFRHPTSRPLRSPEGLAAHFGISVRELDVLELIAQGQSNKDIARDLCITEGTVKVHVRNIMRKMQTTSRMQAATRLIEHKSQLALPVMNNSGKRRMHRREV